MNRLLNPPCLAGTWSYRSFFNDPDLSKPYNDLRFGIGTMVVECAPAGVFRGLLIGGGVEMNLIGSIDDNCLGVVRFQLVGVLDGEEWFYDYLGFVVPVWPNGVDQLPSMVGTLVRRISHGNGLGGVAPAGVVGSWIAVRRDR